MNKEIPMTEENTNRELELYIHIPFCVQKCLYCDFLSMPAEEAIRRHYVDILLEEIKEKAVDCGEYQISSVFIGGGTPSVLPGVQIAEIMETVGAHFALKQNAEITIECNPGTLTQQKLNFYKGSGINRISMGLQSAINEELKRLGRIHTFEEFLHNYDLVRKTGFENVNIDIMSALPEQSMENWGYTLKKVLELRPEHISAYSLIVEEGTPFFEKYGEDELRREQGETPQFLPAEDIEREMYEMTRSMLADKGYFRYEISNYAKPGRECRHNIGYWTRVPYLGLGLGSASLMENTRFSNTSSLREYLKGNFEKPDTVIKESLLAGEEDTEQAGSSLEASSEMEQSGMNRENENRTPVHLNKSQQMEEFMFLGLRMMQGISRKDFRKNFGVEIEGVYGTVLKKLSEQGLLEQNAGRIYLTETGIAVSNYVMSEFLLE